MRTLHQQATRSNAEFIGGPFTAVATDGTGCGQNITLNMQNELRLARLVFCKSCGRIVYLPGD